MSDALPIPVNYIKKLEKENSALMIVRDSLLKKTERLEEEVKALKNKPERNWAMVSKYGGEDW